MSKLLQKIKSNEVQSILNSAKFKVATVSATGMFALQTVAHAAEDTTITAMTTSFQTVSTTCLSAIGGLAPIGLTIFGTMFVWKKGVQFFKRVTQG